MSELKCPECDGIKIVKRTGRTHGCPCEKNQYVCQDCSFYAALRSFQGDIGGR